MFAAGGVVMNLLLQSLQLLFRQEAKHAARRPFVSQFDGRSHSFHRVWSTRWRCQRRRLCRVSREGIRRRRVIWIEAVGVGHLDPLGIDLLQGSGDPARSAVFFVRSKVGHASVCRWMKMVGS